MPIVRRAAGQAAAGAGAGSDPAPSPSQGGVANVRNRPQLRRTAFALRGEIAAVAEQIGRQFAPGVLRRATDRSLDYGRLPLGVLALDLALAGGFRLSRGSMLYGEKSTGKTTLALKAVAQAQRMFPDSVAVWIDVEGTLDLPWAQRLGVELERMLVVEPESGEAAVDIADAMLRTEEVSIIVTDSIAMLTPMKEIDASSEDSLPGIHARLIGNYLRRLNTSTLKERHRRHVPVVLHINQYRMRIGVMFGDPRTLPGGKALEFATSQQVETRNKEHKGKDEHGNELVIFNEHSFVITKDKTGGRIKEGKFKLIRDESAGFPVGYTDQTRTVIAFAGHAGLYRGGGNSHTITVSDRDHNFRKIDDMGRFFFEQPEALLNVSTNVIAYYRRKWNIDT